MTEWLRSIRHGSQKVKLKPLSRSQMDRLTTALGLVGSVSLVLTTNAVIPPKIGGTVTGICTAIVSYCVQKPDPDQKS